MGTQIQKSNWRRLLIAPLLVGVVLSMGACAKSDKNSSNVSTSGYVPGCPGCTNVPGANVLAAAYNTRQDAYSYIEFGVRFHATTSGGVGLQYYGPVTTSGYVYIEPQLWMGGVCPNLPGGQYKVKSLPANGSYAPDTLYQPFNLMNHDFEIVHTSGVKARVHVNYLEFVDDQIIVGMDRTQFPHRMYGEIVVLPSVANIPGCGAKLFFPKNF